MPSAARDRTPCETTWAATAEAAVVRDERVLASYRAWRRADGAAVASLSILLRVSTGLGAQGAAGERGTHDMADRCLRRENVWWGGARGEGAAGLR